MRYFIILFFHLIILKTTAQDVDTVSFEDEVEPGVYFSTQAEPVGGYKQLLEFFERKISDGDTIGKKNSIPLEAIRFHVNEHGGVDTAYVSIPHFACPIHRIIAEELRKTHWVPATVRGKPAPFVSSLSGAIRLTRTVQKKYRCRWSGS
ncbi:hypothetical protein [Chryseosolibacter indicus]|uniref:Uncharacterized protein n=1 Tax=Chryseosolibacter indicus TaxID=2782351 RepID=A0ABS5VV24_9BACT|nr:hypothetical protein [Chryseosolibacter indicus]MBT1705287.1 hypothetical protein [Chryseosolibacter indicus]